MKRRNEDLKSDKAYQAALKKLGERVEGLRAKKDLSIERLCFPVDLSKQAWRNVELGKKDAQISSLFKIAKALKVQVRDLIEF